MAGESLPLLVDKAVKFIDLPITTQIDSEEIKTSLMSNLDNYLTQVSEAPLTKQQRILRIYKETHPLNTLMTL